MADNAVQILPDLFSRILHPTDFSENSHYAFRTACALARENHAKLLVIHIAAPDVSLMGQAIDFVWDDDGTVHLTDPRLSAEARAALGRMPWPKPSDPQIRVEHRLAKGDPAEQILVLAGKLHCDLIVMGTHGRTGLGRVLTGSVAEEVLRKAVCPVLVVKPPQGAPPGEETQTTTRPGDLIDAGPLGTALRSTQTRTLARTPGVEVVRLIVPGGQVIHRAASAGEVTAYCLEGQVVFNGVGRAQVLEAGLLLYLPAGEPYTFEGIEDASLLLTIVSPRK
jgi:nucleotide-binding universal stress UspA family protein/quercetin dioxygenase-like cupin family protein